MSSVIMASGFEALLINSYIVGFLIPLLFLIAGSFIKKIVRGSGWQREDFYLGIELVLSTITSNFIYFYDITKELSKAPTLPSGSLNPLVDLLTKKLNASTSFICVTFFFLLAIMSIHQEWQLNRTNSKGQFLRLGVVCNVLGFIILFLFIAVVKGVQ